MEKFQAVNARNIITTRLYQSPCGTLMLGSLMGRLCLCDWQVARHQERVACRLSRMLNAAFEEGTSDVIEQTALQLDEYFEDGRRNFSVPLLFVGTDFQKTVWNALLRIPYGQTISYGELARRIGKPQSVRAVANANGANAISILVPCHRVVGSDHSLTGYAGGLTVKRWLLSREIDVASAFASYSPT